MHHREKHPETVKDCYNCKLLSLKFNGLVALEASRKYGKTGREMGKENREEFIKNKGYEPVSAKERWI